MSQPIHMMRLIWFRRKHNYEPGGWWAGDYTVTTTYTRLPLPFLCVRCGKRQVPYLISFDGGIKPERWLFGYPDKAPEWLLQYVRENTREVLQKAAYTRGWKKCAQFSDILDDATFRRTQTCVSSIAEYVVNKDWTVEEIVDDFEDYLRGIGESQDEYSY